MEHYHCRVLIWGCSSTEEQLIVYQKAAGSSPVIPANLLFAISIDFRYFTRIKTYICYMNKRRTKVSFSIPIEDSCGDDQWKINTSPLEDMRHAIKLIRESGLRKPTKVLDIKSLISSRK